MDIKLSIPWCLLYHYSIQEPWSNDMIWDSLLSLGIAYKLVRASKFFLNSFRKSPTEVFFFLFTSYSEDETKNQQFQNDMESSYKSGALPRKNKIIVFQIQLLLLKFHQNENQDKKKYTAKLCYLLFAENLGFQLVNLGASLRTTLKKEKSLKSNF